MCVCILTVTRHNIFLARLKRVFVNYQPDMIVGFYFETLALLMLFVLLFFQDTDLEEEDGGRGDSHCQVRLPGAG